LARAARSGARAVSGRRQRSAWTDTATCRLRFACSDATTIDGDGSEQEILDVGEIVADAAGGWQVPRPPVMRDWVLVVEAQ
jgi:hypothetical protein